MLLSLNALPRAVYASSTFSVCMQIWEMSGCFSGQNKNNNATHACDQPEAKEASKQFLWAVQLAPKPSVAQAQSA